MKHRIGSILGPWPFRPLWMFLLLVTVQNFGVVDARFFLSPDNQNLEPIDAGVVSLGLSRLGISLAIAMVIVGVEWVLWRATTGGQSHQRVWAYALMIIAGAAAAAGFWVAFQRLNDSDRHLSYFAPIFLHYLILVFILHTLVGVIGSRVSDSTARAEAALAQVAEQERRFVASEEQARRIAAEFLHDRVQADLLVIAIELRRVAADSPPDVQRRLASIVEVVESVRHSDVRDTSRILSPMVQATGLASALADLGDRWSPAMVVTMAFDEGLGTVEDTATGADTGLGIYRIVEQALLNSAGHGQARIAQVSVMRKYREGRNWLRILITDDGFGFEPVATEVGGGFATSQVWARLLDGKWSINSRPGEGAVVTAWIPQP